MQSTRPSLLRRLFGGALLLLVLAGVNPTAQAQTSTVVFDLDNVMLLPDISHPGAPAEQMTGTFHWTYPVGQFENGVGTFVDLYIPWWGTDINSMTINIDMGSLEFVMPGNVHGSGLDVTLFLTQDLSPTVASPLDLTLSQFEVQQFGITHQGHMSSGAVVPRDPPQLQLQGTCPNFQFNISGATPLSQVALLYANGLSSYIIPTGMPCAGTLLSLDSSVAVGAMLQTDFFGNATLQRAVPPRACGNIYLQVLDLSSCTVSPFVILQ